MGTTSALPEGNIALVIATDADARGRGGLHPAGVAQRSRGGTGGNAPTTAAARLSRRGSTTGLALWERVTVNRKRDFNEDLDDLPIVSRVYKKAP